MYSDAAMTRTHIIVIGAGPIGLELAVALKQLGVDYVHLEANQIGHTISWFPLQMRFFSSPQRIAIAGVPFNTPYQEKATREQYLTYLRNIVDQFDLDVHTYERVTSISRQNGHFTVQSTRGGEQHTYEAPYVVLAIGDLRRRGFRFTVLYTGKDEVKNPPPDVLFYELREHIDRMVNIFITSVLTGVALS